MDKKDIIREVIFNNLFEQNDKECRDKIGYELREGLEMNGIDYTTINTYSPPDIVDKNQIKIVIDDEEFIVSNTGDFFNPIILIEKDEDK